MSAQKLKPVWARNVLMTCLVLVISACGSTEALHERFDSSSGITWSVGAEIAAFARTEPQFSRSARDYLYLGPVAVNRRGAVEYYLWVGVATTLDRGYLAPAAGLPSRLVVYVHGEPIELGLAPWSGRVPELDGARAYAPPVAVHTQLAARVTRDQLRMLSEAPVESVEISGDNGATRPFLPWEPWSGWPAFLASAAEL
jgi:hypothetical protein